MRYWLIIIGMGLIISSTGSAQVNLPIYNTGVDDSHNPLPGGSADPHYVISYASSLAPAVVLSDGNLWWEWPKPTDARWIYNQDAFDSGIRSSVLFTTTFDLTGYNPATANLSGSCSADQFGEILLNGNPTGFSLPDGNWRYMTSFIITNGFIPGLNTLQFRVELPDGGDGLVVSGLNLTAYPLPFEEGPFRLNINRTTPTQSTLLWPTNAINWLLETTTNVMASHWNTVTNVPDIAGSNFYLTINSTATEQLFRLRRP